MKHPSRPRGLPPTLLALLLGALCLSLLPACSSSVEYRTSDWSTYQGPGAEHFQQEELALYVTNDPLEPTNRRTWAFNQGFAAVVRPLAAGYRFVVPEVAREGIGNFFHNLLYPVRLVSNLVQGKGGGAWDETKRFAVNTTVGILGFRDAAGEAMSRSDEDFGQSFGKAGWEDSSFLVLPFLGPSTTRDSVGLIGDTLLDPATYFFPASIVSRGNSTSDEIEDYHRLEESSYDLYRLAQLLGSLNRGVKLDDYVHPDDVCVHCVAQETIQAIFLTYQDPEFPGLAEHHTAELPDADRSVKYTLFLQPEPAPIVYILPGLGGHRVGDSAYGLAEMVFRHGLSAATLSNAMNFEFIESASSVDLPGFAPADAHDVHIALDAIHRDIETRHADRITSHVLMGLSLGAVHTLYIAADEGHPDLSLKRFDRYVAINPPVRLEYGMQQLDSYYNAPLSIPPDLLDGALQHTLRKALEVSGGHLQPNHMLPFNELESQFLIGLAFRQTLQDVIFQTQLRNNMGVLQTDVRSNDRAPAYREISEYSYLEYFYAFVLPSCAASRDDISLDEAGARRLFDLCDLRSLEAGLTANERVHVVTNRDDFLLDEGDFEWLRQTFAERCLYYEHGGHLGNLYTTEVQDQVMLTILAAMDLDGAELADAPGGRALGGRDGLDVGIQEGHGAGALR